MSESNEEQALNNYVSHYPQHQQAQMHHHHYQHQPAAGDYNHHYPHGTAMYYDYPHSQVNNINMPAYDYFHPPMYNEVDPHHQYSEHHRGHVVHQLQCPPHHHQQTHMPEGNQTNQQQPHHYAHLYPAQVHNEVQQPQSATNERKRMSANDAWNVKYNLLLQFRERHGHVDVPQTYKENRSLGKWVGKQREQYKIYFKNLQSPPDERSSCAMTEERVNKLNEINFKWTMGKGQYGKIHGIFDGSENMVRLWEDKFALLERYKSVYGDVDVPYVTSTGKFDHPVPSHPEKADQAFDDETLKGLFRWVKHQRQKYQDVQTKKVAAGQALEGRFQRLIDLGLNLSVTKEKDPVRQPQTSRNLTKVKEYRNNLWETRYIELCEYVEKNGHANIPASSKENPQLARWVGVQRDSFRLKKRQRELQQLPSNIHLAKNMELPPMPSKANALTDERIRRLESIGFEFSIHENRWDEKFKDLCAFKEKKGHLRVRHSENKQLYEWVTRQRNQFRDYMQGITTAGNTINSERIARLDKINFKWQYTFEPLNTKALKAAVDKAEKAQKEKTNKLKGKSPTEVSKDCSAKGGVAEIGNETANEAMNDSGAVNLDAMAAHETHADNKSYGAQQHEDSNNMGDLVRNGHNIDHFEQPLLMPGCLEPYSLHETHVVMGAPYVPSMHKKGTKPQLWQQSYDQLAAFQNEHGHCRVPGRYPENPKLGMWVKLQREDYKHLRDGKASPMNEFRIELLQKIGFEWTIFNMDERRNAWNTRLEELSDFKERYGHCDVPQKYTPNKALGKWVSKQREAYRAYTQDKPSSLTQDKIDRLQELGFRFIVGRGKATRTWDSFFDDLVAFKQKFGHTHIPVSYTPDPAFGKWVYQQRLNMEKRLCGKATNLVTKQRLDKLRDIGFVFHVKEKDTGRKRRSDFGSVREKNCTKKIKSGEELGEAGEEAKQQSASLPDNESEGFSIPQGLVDA